MGGPKCSVGRRLRLTFWVAARPGESCGCALPSAPFFFAAPLGCACGSFAASAFFPACAVCAADGGGLGSGGGCGVTGLTIGAMGLVIAGAVIPHSGALISCKVVHRNRVVVSPDCL